MDIFFKGKTTRKKGEQFDMTYIKLFPFFACTNKTYTLYKQTNPHSRRKHDGAFIDLIFIQRAIRLICKKLTELPFQSL